MNRRGFAVLVAIGVGTGALAGPAAAQAPAAPLTLGDVVSRAVASSAELRGLRAAVAEASANTILAQQAFLPSASVSTTPGYATGLPIAILGSVPAIGTIEAHQVLYDLSTRADVLAARSEVQAASAELDARTRETAQSASELYARYATDLEQVAAAQKRVTAYETIVSRLDALRREGRARDLDVDRAALQVSTARRAALQAETALELDELRLRRMIDWPAGEPLNVRPEPLPPNGPLPSDTLVIAEQNDPALGSLHLRIEQLQRATALQRNLFRPTIAAQVQYSRLFDRYRRFYLNFKPDDFSVGATIDLPLWTGGRRAAIVSRLSAQLERATAELQQRKQTIELSVREAEAGVKDAIAESELADRVHELAAESLRVSQAMANEGRGEPNDVTLAEAALAEADEEVATAELHLRTARARLAVLRGELPETKK